MTAEDTSRTLRQRLVQLHGKGFRTVRFRGARVEAEQQGLLRECERLGILGSFPG